MQVAGEASQQPSPPPPRGGLAPGLQHTQAGSTSSLGRPAFPFSPLCLGKNFPSLHWLGWRIRGPGYLLSLLEARPTVLQAASLARSLGHCNPPQGSAPSILAPDRPSTLTLPGPPHSLTVAHLPCSVSDSVPTTHITHPPPHTQVSATNLVLRRI